MDKSPPKSLPHPIVVNGIKITHVVIGRHYRDKHSHYMSDDLILDLVIALNGNSFDPDSIGGGIEYFVGDIQLRSESGFKIYRLIWLFEGKRLEIIGVVNAFRVKKVKGKKE